MARYRIVKVPIQGNPDKYRVEVFETRTISGWFSKWQITEWCGLDISGDAWYIREGSPSPPPLSLFDSEQKAKDYIDERKEYINKPEEVVFDTLTDNPPKESRNMKRYWLFCFNKYYPKGGFQDFRGSFDTIYQCIEKASKVDKDNYYQVFDSQDQKIVVDTCNIDAFEVYQALDWEAPDRPELSEVYTEDFLTEPSA